MNRRWLCAALPALLASLLAPTPAAATSGNIGDDPTGAEEFFLKSRPEGSRVFQRADVS